MTIRKQCDSMVVHKEHEWYQGGFKRKCPGRRRPAKMR